MVSSPVETARTIVALMETAIETTARRVKGNPSEQGAIRDELRSATREFVQQIAARPRCGEKGCADALTGYQTVRDSAGMGAAYGVASMVTKRGLPRGSDTAASAQGSPGDLVDLVTNNTFRMAEHYASSTKKEIDAGKETSASVKEKVVRVMEGQIGAVIGSHETEATKELFLSALAFAAPIGAAYAVLLSPL